MGVRRGEEWGRVAAIPETAAVCSSDREGSEHLANARRSATPLPPLALRGGDLARTLGATGLATPGSQGTHLRVDLGAALIDGELHWFLAHLVARRSWLHGRVVILANAAFLGDWNIAPRAHPGDGRLDLLDGSPSLGDRVKARSRLPSGTHLPHPAIVARSIDAVQLDLERPTPIRLDGHLLGPARSLSIRVEPAAVDVYI